MRLEVLGWNHLAPCVVMVGGAVRASYEHDNESSGSIRDGEFSDQLRDYQACQGSPCFTDLVMFL
jgi:hypothetical protein